MFALAILDVIQKNDENFRFFYGVSSDESFKITEKINSIEFLLKFIVHRAGGLFTAI